MNWHFVSVFVHSEHSLKIYDTNSQTYSHTELKRADHNVHTLFLRKSSSTAVTSKATCGHPDGGAALVLHQSKLHGDWLNESYR